MPKYAPKPYAEATAMPMETMPHMVTPAGALQPSDHLLSVIVA